MAQLSEQELVRREKLSKPKEIERGSETYTVHYNVVSRSTPDICTKNSKLQRCK